MLKEAEFYEKIGVRQVSGDLLNYYYIARKMEPPIVVCLDLMSVRD
jgi:hypothetical protein